MRLLQKLAINNCKDLTGKANELEVTKMKRPREHPKEKDN